MEIKRKVKKLELNHKLDNNGSENRFFKVSTYSYGSLGKKWLYLYHQTKKE